MSIKGESSNNPVILFLHGGPGFPLSPFAQHFQSPLEKNYTVVHWDQRGAGKSYPNTPPETMNLEQFVRDAYDVVQHLKMLLKKDTVILMSHSWGGILGINLISRYPEDFSAYIGIGQVVDYKKSLSLGYEFAQMQAEARGLTQFTQELKDLKASFLENNEAAARVIGIIEGVGGGMHKSINLSQIIGANTDYTNSDKQNIPRGLAFSCSHLWDTVMGTNFTSTHTRFEIPVCFISGRYDHLTSGLVVEAYCKQITAPKKSMLWFEESAHFPFFEEPERFCDAITKLLLQ